MWIYVSIPRVGDASWKRSGDTFDSAAVSASELSFTPMGALPSDLWLDGLAWY